MPQHARKTALFDCDGPLSMFTERTVELVQTRIPGWMPADEWAIDSNLSDEMRAWVKLQWKTRGFASSLMCVPGAAEAVRAVEEVADVYIVTAPMDDSETWSWERVQWVKRHLGLDRTRIISAVDKHLVFGHVLVDDKVTNLQTWENHRRGRPLLWYTDQNVKYHHTIGGAAAWSEMLSLVLGALQ